MRNFKIVTKSKPSETVQPEEPSGTAPRRRGRPPRPPETVKRHPLVIRTTQALKEDLVKASNASGRSLTEEIEYRLTRSIAEDHGKSELDLRLDAMMSKVRESMLVVVGYHGRLGDTFAVFPEPVVRPTSKPKSKSRKPRDG